MRFAYFWFKGLPNTTVNESDFVWRYIYPYFDNPWVSFVSATASVFLIAIFVSQLNLQYGIIRSRTSMTFVIPLLILSSHPIFLVMSPIYIAILFILWSLFPLFDSHQQSHQQKIAFQYSVFISMASLFSIYALLLLPFWWREQNQLSSRFAMRTFFASLWGVILSYWIVFACYVFGDNLEGFVSPFYGLIQIVDFTVLPTFTVPQWGFLATLLIFFIVYLILDRGKVSRDKVSSQKILSFLNVLILATLLFQVLYLTSTLFWLYSALTLLSFILAHYYTVVIRKWEVRSFLILILLVAILYFVNFFTTRSPF